MIKFLLFILITFSGSQLFAKKCYVQNQFWKTGGVSHCSYGTGLNGALLEIVHTLPDSNNTPCPGVAFVCDHGQTDNTDYSSSLPSWVGYNPEAPQGKYPYTCGNTHLIDELFEGVHGEGYYSCNSGSPVPIPNVESIQPENTDQPLICKEGFGLVTGTGLTINKGSYGYSSYTTYSCSPTDPLGSQDYFFDSDKDKTLLKDPVSYSNPDGSSTLLLPDGTKQTLHPNGTVTIEYTNGDIVTGQITTTEIGEGDYIKYKGKNNNGDKIWKMNDDTVYLLEPNGDLTTVKPDNTTTVEHNVPDTWTPNQSYGYQSNINGGLSGSGSTGSSPGYSGGSGSGSSNTQAGTTNDNKTDEELAKQEEPIPEEEEPTANNCTDSNLTAQEKLLCELNRGIKKINSESNPEYSVNNILNNINTDIFKNEKALIQNTTNITKNMNTTVSNTQKSLNNISKLNDNLGTQSDKLQSINQSLKDINQNMKSRGSTSGGGSSTESVNADEYFNPDSTVNTNNVTDNANLTDSKINALISVYTNFALNIQNSFTIIQGQIDSTKSLITGTNNIFTKENITNCPISYEFDLSFYGKGQKLVTIDICKYFSELYSLGYFIVYVGLMIVLIFGTFIIIGVLAK